MVECIPDNLRTTKNALLYWIKAKI